MSTDQNGRQIVATLDDLENLAASIGEGGGPQTVYVQPTDPGAVGAGKLWVDSTEPPFAIRVRSSDDDAWVDIFAQTPSGYVAPEGFYATAVESDVALYRKDDQGVIRTELLFSEGRLDIYTRDANGMQIATWEVGYDGYGGLLKDEEGNTRVAHNATPGTSLDTDASWDWVVRNAVGDAKAHITLDETGIHFAGIVPEVPATPTEQDIVDALLALGLVTQAAP